jgi:hypothetical protein
MDTARPTPRLERLAAGRGAGFRPDELRVVLELLEEHLPIGRDEKELVLSIHNRQFSQLRGTVESIRRKFAGLCRSRIPTGNPTCPPEMRTAKCIRFLMTQRADIGEVDAVPDTELGVDDVGVGQDQEPSRPASSAAEAHAVAAEGAAAASPPTSPVVDDSARACPSPSPADAIAPPRRTLRISPRPLVGRQPSSDAAHHDDDIAALVKLQLLQAQEDERSREEP